MADTAREVKPVRFMDDPRIPLEGMSDFSPTDKGDEPEQYVAQSWPYGTNLHPTAAEQAGRESEPPSPGAKTPEVGDQGSGDLKDQGGLTASQTKEPNVCPPCEKGAHDECLGDPDVQPCECSSDEPHPQEKQPETKPPTPPDPTPAGKVGKDQGPAKSSTKA